MLSRNDFRHYLRLAAIGCIFTIMICIGTVNASAKTAYKYQEIKHLYKKTLQESEPSQLEPLIEKSQVFIDTYPNYKKVDEVYYFLGNALIRVDRTEEGIERFQQLIKAYPKAFYFSRALLEMGLACDKLGQHEKADATYQQLVKHPKYGSRTFGKMAKELLALDKAERNGQLPGKGPQGGQPDALVGKKEIDFQVKDLNDAELSLEKYRGKVILLDFWATWCGPCIHEMPTVKAVYAKYKDEDFQIVGISLDTDRSRLLSYIEKEGIKWPQFFDGKGWKNEIAQMYQVQSIPRMYLIDGTGVIRKANVRGRALEPAVAELIRENKASKGLSGQ